MCLSVFTCMRILALNLQHFLITSLKKTKTGRFLIILTGMCDGETVGGLQVVNIVIEVEGFLCHILVGVIQLDSKPEGAVLLHCRAHEQSTYGKENVT